MSITVCSTDSDSTIKRWLAKYSTKSAHGDFNTWLVEEWMSQLLLLCFDVICPLLCTGHDNPALIRLKIFPRIRLKWYAPSVRVGLCAVRSLCIG